MNKLDECLALGSVLVLLFAMLLVLIGVSGCGGSAESPMAEPNTPTPPIECISPYTNAPKLQTFTVEDNKTRALRQAVFAWNSALGIQLFVIAAQDPEITITTQDLEAPMIGLSGVYSLGGGEASCDVFIDIEYVEVYDVYIHELGHCLGLGHSQDIESIMFFAINFEQVIQQEDIDHVQARYPEIFGVPIPEDIEECPQLFKESCVVKEAY